MSVVITASGNFGPYKTIEVLADRLRCDGTDLPFSVIGEYSISEDDGLAPQPPAPAPAVPQSVTMRQARLALLQAGLLGTVNTTIAAMPGAAGEAARIEWEYSGEVWRNKELVAALGPALGLNDAQLDALFVTAAAL